MIMQHIFTHVVHVIIKKTWEPASLTEPEQFTCCNKAINYIFLHFLFNKNWSDTLICRERERESTYQPFVYIEIASLSLTYEPDKDVSAITTKLFRFLHVAALFCDHRYLLFMHCKMYIYVKKLLCSILWM